MANAPLGKLDHIGIAVSNLDDAIKFFSETLGAALFHRGDNPQAGYKLAELDLGGMIFELLEPLGENSFLHKFLEKHGEGLHHLTFNVPDSKDKVAELKSQGVRIVDETQWSPTSYEAFISPRSAHGVLIQIGSGYPTLSDLPEFRGTEKP